MLVNNKSKSNTITTPIHFLFGFFFLLHLSIYLVSQFLHRRLVIWFSLGESWRNSNSFFFPLPLYKAKTLCQDFLSQNHWLKGFLPPPRQKRNASENTIALRMLFAFLLLLAINLWSLIFWRSLARLFRISAFFCLSHLQWWDNCYHKLPRISKNFLTEKENVYAFLKKKIY